MMHAQMSGKARLRLLPAILTFTAALQCVPAHAQTRQFENWIAGCDNENVCTAVAFAKPGIKASGGKGVPLIEIRHHPMRDATPEIRIVDPDLINSGAGNAGVAARIFVNGGAGASTREVATFEPLPDNRGGFRFRGEDAWSILHALRGPAPARLTIGSKTSWLLRTEGLTDALAYFDERQDLADTPAALVRKPRSDLTDYAHPRPPQAPTLRLASFSRIGKVENTDEWPEPPRRCATPPGTVIQGYLLPGGTRLWRRDCGSEDGINIMSAWYIGHGDLRHRALLDWPDEDHASRPDASLLFNAEVGAVDGQIIATRYRSPDEDCGVRERWGVTMEGPILLIERREMPVCSKAGPRHWIVTYRTYQISPE